MNRHVIVLIIDADDVPSRSTRAYRAERIWFYTGADVLDPSAGRVCSFNVDEAAFYDGPEHAIQQAESLGGRASGVFVVAETIARQLERLSKLDRVIAESELGERLAALLDP